MPHFADQLADAIRRTGNAVCVGLVQCLLKLRAGERNAVDVDGPVDQLEVLRFNVQRMNVNDYSIRKQFRVEADISAPDAAHFNRLDRARLIVVSPSGVSAKVRRQCRSSCAFSIPKRGSSDGEHLCLR